MFKKIISTTAICISVLTMSSFAVSGQSGDKMDMKNMQANIVEVAVETGIFNTLVAAVQAADLVSVLQSDGPFTVFAPTDEAFAKLPAGTVEMLLKPENKDKLASVLTYHVVSGKVTSSQVVDLTTATTVQGQNVSIKVVDGKVMINDAMVTSVDVAASNGIIHVIDSVLLPK